MFNLRNSSVVLSALGLCSLAACASTVPQELTDARLAYQRAQQSQAPQVAPAQLQDAKQALDQAETAFNDDGVEPKTRTLAYVARRKAELAAVQGNMNSAIKERELSEKELLSSATSVAESKSKELNQANQQVQIEKQGREEADRRMRDAMQRLTAIASVKQDQRGTIITLPGGVLFETAKSALLSSAREKLNQVSDALAQDREATVMIEGHTDSQGNEDTNQKLSQARAESVRDYLVQRGVAADRIRAEGKGKSQPIASNKTAEGRADNRRVEIVVNNATQLSQR